MDKKKKLIIAAILISITLFLTIGFAFGRITSEDFKCSQNPLGYGIEKFNLANNDDYFCNCHGKRPFSFDAEQIVLNGLRDLPKKETTQQNITKEETNMSLILEMFN